MLDDLQKWNFLRIVFFFFFSYNSKTAQKERFFFQSLQTAHTVVLSIGTKYWIWKDSREKNDPQPYWGRMEKLPHFSSGQQCCLPAGWAASLVEALLNPSCMHRAQPAARNQRGVSKVWPAAPTLLLVALSVSLQAGLQPSLPFG